MNGIAKRLSNVIHPVSKGLKTSVVFNPIHFYRRYFSKIFQLFSQCFLLAIGAIKRINVRKKFFGIWLHRFPRRVTELGIKPLTFRGKYIRELQLPMKELLLTCNTAGDGQSFVSRLRKGCRGRCLVYFISGPEPESAPEVHTFFESMIPGVVQDFFLIETGALFRFMYRKSVKIFEYLGQFVMNVNICNIIP